MREANYINIGLQLKKIRDQLDWPLENISKATWQKVDRIIKNSWMPGLLAWKTYITGGLKIL